MKKFLSKIPDECPKCETELAPDLEDDWKVETDSGEDGYTTILRCPKCGHEVPWEFVTHAEAAQDDWQ